MADDHSVEERVELLRAVIQQSTWLIGIGTSLAVFSCIAATLVGARRTRMG